MDQIVKEVPGVGTSHEMPLEALVGEKELPTVNQLSNATGLHFSTVIAEPGSLGVPVGIKLMKLVCNGEDITPYLPINELDCMIVGLLALSPAINRKVKEAAEQLNDINPKDSKVNG